MKNRNIMKINTSVVQVLNCAICTLATTLLIGSLTQPVEAAISFDGGGNTNWWFDPTNWSRQTPAPPCPCLPPGQDGGGTVARTDAQINGGTGAWDLTGEGVVYDPDNDPFFADAANLNYPTGSAYAGAPYNMDYGPQSIYRLYISRNTTAQNLLTLKSGELWIDSTTIIGRSGSTVAQSNEGRVVQDGTSVMMPLASIEIGQSESSGLGNGVWEYRSGILDVAADAGVGIRLSNGRNDSGPGGHGRFIVHNPASGGFVRTFDYQSVANRGNLDNSLFPDGVNSGVAISEFHFENGGTRPVQVKRQLVLNNGVPLDTGGMVSSRLDLVLNEAPVTVDGVPQDLGLFDVDFSNLFAGSITGQADIDNDLNADAVFANADGSEYYLEGDTVSALFSGTRYDWTISYTGEISWTDADNSVVNSIAGAGSGVDVVLIGLGSEQVGVPGDYDGDGDVDGQDFLGYQRDDPGQIPTWAANYPVGGSPIAAALAVPEPSSLALSCLAAMLLVRAGCERRK